MNVLQSKNLEIQSSIPAIFLNQNVQISTQSERKNPENPSVRSIYSANDVANLLEISQIIPRYLLHPQYGIPFIYQPRLTLQYPQLMAYTGRRQPLARGNHYAEKRIESAN